MFDQTFLGANHISNGDDGEVHVVRFAGVRIDGLGAGGSGTAADDVGTDDKIFIGVDRLAGADHFVPPARFFILRGVPAANVGIAGKGVRNQNCIGSISVESSSRFIADVDIFEFPAAIQRQRAFQLVILRSREKNRIVVQLSFDFITSKV